MSETPKHCPGCGMKTTTPLKYSNEVDDFKSCNNCGEVFKLETRNL